VVSASRQVVQDFFHQPNDGFEKGMKTWDDRMDEPVAV
jgi:hypothetical protein